MKKPKQQQYNGEIVRAFLLSGYKMPPAQMKKVQQQFGSTLKTLGGEIKLA